MPARQIGGAPPSRAEEFMNETTNSPLPSVPEPKETSAVDPERRAALAKMGRFAAYTAPVLLGMMTSTRTVSASTVPGPD
jgi:hypothetical protein